MGTRLIGVITFMKKIQVFRMIAFLLVVALLVSGLTAVALMQPDFSQTAQRYDDFKDLEENTVDVIFTGTSGIDRYWIAPKAFEEYGMTAYNLSSDAQPTWLVKNVLEEATKTQSPKLVVIDTRAFTTKYGKQIGNIEIGARYLTDGDCFSFKNRIDAIERTLVALKTIKPEKDFDRKTFYLPLIKHHGAWANIQDFVDEYSYSVMGYYMCSIRTPVTTKEIEDFSYETTQVGEMHPIAQGYLYELLDYLDTKDYEVLFLNTPQGRSEGEMRTVNAVTQVLESRGYKHLVCYVDETYDKSKDFYNQGHVNFHGAEKFTDFFAQYLKDNYDLEDHRDDERCQQWYGHYDEIKATVAQWEAEIEAEKEAKAKK